MLNPDKIPPEVKLRDDLRIQECRKCYGRGRYEIDYISSRTNPCFECGQSGFKVEKQCPECDSWTLKWTDAPTQCNDCGYEEPAHPRYKEAMEHLKEKSGEGDDS